MPDPTNGNPMTIDDLAEIIQRTMATKEDLQELRTDMREGFQRVDARFAQTDRRLAQLELNVQHVTETVNLIHHDTADLPALRQEVEDLRTRVARLEAKLGLAA